MSTYINQVNSGKGWPDVEAHGVQPEEGRQVGELNQEAAGGTSSRVVPGFDSMRIYNLKKRLRQKSGEG
jgi:hypothetical protein